MKLLQLEIEGFGPFKDKQSINFTDFEQHGLFLISGETGVGKSSILDAITYALYDFTPRWEDAEANAEHKSVRSSYCEPNDPTGVRLTFSLPNSEAEKTFIVERRISGLDKHGVERKADVTLKEVSTDGEERGLAEGKKEVGIAIRKLVRLDETEFLQVALLAQGKFEAFLTANSSKRLELIRKLFNTRRFELIQNEIKTRKTEVEREVGESLQQVATAVDGLSQSLETTVPEVGRELDWLKDLFADAQSRVSEKELEVETTTTYKDLAQKAFDDATTAEELVALKVEQKQHDSKSKENDADQSKLKIAERASKVAPVFEALEAAKTDEQNARQALEETDAPKDLPRDLNALKALQAETSQKLGALEPVLEREIGLAEAKEAQGKLDGDIEALVSEESRTKLEIENLKLERAASKKLADLLSPREQALNEAQSSQRSFEEFDALKEQLKEATSQESQAKGAETAARKGFETIFRDYSLNAAHRLSVDLIDGHDCPVCGSKEHPKKAKAAGQAVSEADLEAAKVLLENCMLAHKELSDARSLLEDKFKELTEVHSGQDRKSLELAAGKAQKLFEESKASKERLDEVSALLDLTSDFMIRFTQLQGEIIELRARSTSKRSELLADEKLVEKNKNGFESVADYQSYLEGKLAILTELVEALTLLDTAVVALKKSETKLSKSLKEHSFTSQKEFSQSLMDDGSFAELREKIARYNEESTRLRTLLSQDKYLDLPKKTLPTEEAETALSNAKLAFNGVISELAVLKRNLKLIQECQKRVKSIMPTLERQIQSLDLHRGVYEALHGQGANTLQMTLETYFAAAELEVILEAANTQLQTMDAGKQFTLVHSDKALKKTGKTGLGIEVICEHSGGLRNPVTLSGGEKFQVSLAIALGLAQVVSERSGAIRIDTLFVDEGFGSLSKNVLETAMTTLDSLKQGGRTIGVISHVEKMQETITAKLHVAKIPAGPSFVKEVVV